MSAVTADEGEETAKRVHLPGSIPVTVVVPVKNEERNLTRCLNGLSRFSEVVVVDSNSTDGTKMIARSCGARLIEFHWDGRYPKKRNWLLINHVLENDWVLFLDADEFVGDDFCDEVAAAIQSSPDVGYWLNYTNYFLGRRLKHGVPQRKLALFKIGSGLYERIEEDSWSGLDMEVHEHPILVGSVGEIRAPVVHNDYRGIEKFLDRHRDYARWEARRIRLLEQEGTVSGLTLRQRFKYRYLAYWWYPLFYFAYSYFLRFGFLDGAAGLQHAFYKTWYFVTIRLLVCELRRGQPGNEVGPHGVMSNKTPAALLECVGATSAPTSGGIRFGGRREGDNCKASN